MKLTVQTFLTLDGVMQAPGGPEEDPSDAFTHGGWQAPFPDPAVGEFVTELTSHASAFLFGRRTFGIFRGYWPDQTGPANPIATAINSLPKYVVSGTLSQADATWRGEHPGNDAPGRPHRDRSRHRHRHLRTSRPGPPRPDVTGRGWPRQAVMSRGRYRFLLGAWNEGDFSEADKHIAPGMEIYTNGLSISSEYGGPAMARESIES